MDIKEFISNIEEIIPVKLSDNQKIRLESLLDDVNDQAFQQGQINQQESTAY